MSTRNYKELSATEIKEIIDLNIYELKTPFSGTGEPIGQLVLPDGRTAEVQVIITTDEDEFM